MTEFIRDASMGAEDVMRTLADLKARAERGEIECMALRVFKTDGTYEDIALGGTEEERAEALRKLRENN